MIMFKTEILSSYTYIFQWTYIAGNNWGADENGIECVECGPQEHFRACADISIKEYESNRP